MKDKSMINMAGTSMGSGVKMCGSQIGKHMKMGGPNMMGGGEKKKVKTNTVRDTKYTKTTIKRDGFKKKEMKLEYLDGIFSGGGSSTDRYKVNYSPNDRGSFKVSSTTMSTPYEKHEAPKQFRNINKLVRKGLRSKK